MRWSEPQWDDENIEKIAPRATADEVDTVLFDPSTRIERAKRGDDSDYRRYLCLGLTEEGRYLFVVAVYLGREVVRPISARDMNDAERARFKSKRT